LFLQEGSITSVNDN
jgi:hypothetical protein